MTHTRSLKKKKPKKKWFRTPQNKGNTCQVFGGKPPCHETVTGTSFGFPHRRFSKVTFLLQVATWLVWRSAYMSLVGT